MSVIKSAWLTFNNSYLVAQNLQLQFCDELSDF